MIEEINFLIENSYADSEKAASKILEAASDEFYGYIMEASQAQYDRLRQRIAAETNPQRKAQLQAQLDQMVTDQRQRVLNPKKPKSKQIIRNAVKSSVIKSKPAKAVGRFLKYTFLGGLVP